VSIKLLPTERPDSGRSGPRRVCSCRAGRDDARESFELTVGKPEVVPARSTQGQEPTERLTVDVPRAPGYCHELMGTRKGLLEPMTNHGTGGCGWSTWCLPRLLVSAPSS
jgi:hypothetical protein